MSTVLLICVCSIISQRFLFLGLLTDTISLMNGILRYTTVKTSELLELVKLQQFVLELLILYRGCQEAIPCNSFLNN